MLAKLPVEIILLICEYPESKELRQLAQTNKRMMGIIKRYLPIAFAREILFYLKYEHVHNLEGRICLFNSYTCSVEWIAKFHDWYSPYELATTQNKVFGINDEYKSLKIYDYNTRQISRGPDPPEWRYDAFLAYFDDKLYYFCGRDPKTRKDTNRVDVLIDGKWQTGPAFPLPTGEAQTITCDGILYVIDGRESRKIYRLSDDEREWVEVGELPERRDNFGVASLNGRIYITGGLNYPDILKSCLCFDPSAPVESRFSWLLEKVTGTSRYWSRTSRIADMNYAGHDHSLIVANGKLYAIRGLQNISEDFYNSIEEYDPQTNEWRIVGEINSHKVLFHLYYLNDNDEGEGRICLFNSFTYSVEEIAKFHNWYLPYEVATTQNKIFLIHYYDKKFEIFDLDTRQILRGPDPPEWRLYGSVTYFKNKLYYLSGEDSKTYEDTNRVDVLIDGKWQTGPAFPLPTGEARTITCDGILYVIGGYNNRKIYRLSDDEREWIEIGEIPEVRFSSGITSLNGRIYITGGDNVYGDDLFKSCLCFDPSAPVDSRISQIADMNYGRWNHSLIVSNGKLYAIGGSSNGNFCDSIEEYDPQTNEWREVGNINIK